MVEDRFSHVLVSDKTRSNLVNFERRAFPSESQESPPERKRRKKEPKALDEEDAYASHGSEPVGAPFLIRCGIIRPGEAVLTYSAGSVRQAIDVFSDGKVQVSGKIFMGLVEAVAYLNNGRSSRTRSRDCWDCVSFGKQKLSDLMMSRLQEPKPRNRGAAHERRRTSRKEEEGHATREGQEATPASEEGKAATPAAKRPRHTAKQKGLRRRRSERRRRGRKSAPSPKGSL